MATSGLAASGLMFGLNQFASASKKMSPNDVINIGVVGTGDRGNGLIMVMKEIPQLKVMACCDVLPFRLEKAMLSAEKGAKAYANYHDMLNDKNLDAILIATPLHMHHQMALDAMDADKHVYCEKTMAFTIDEALDLVKKTKNFNKIFQTGHQYHSSRLYYKIIEIVNEGHIGKVTGFDCQWNRNGNWRREVPDPKLERMINWRMYKEYSGGLLAELSSHQIDFVNWVTKSTPISVVGSGGIDYWKDGRETNDNVRVVFDYPNGIKASFTCLTSNAHEGYQIKVLGDKATIKIGPNSAKIYPENSLKKEMGLVDGVSGATAGWMDESGAIPVKVDHADPSKQALEDFAEAIINNTEPISNVRTGANASIAVFMGNKTIETREIQHWKSEYNI